MRHAVGRRSLLVHQRPILRSSRWCGSLVDSTTGVLTICSERSTSNRAGRARSHQWPSTQRLRNSRETRAVSLFLKNRATGNHPAQPAFMGVPGDLCATRRSIRRSDALRSRRRRALRRHKARARSRADGPRHGPGGAVCLHHQPGSHQVWVIDLDTQQGSRLCSWAARRLVSWVRAAGRTYVAGPSWPNSTPGQCHLRIAQLGYLFLTVSLV